MAQIQIQPEVSGSIKGEKINKKKSIPFFKNSGEQKTIMSTETSKEAKVNNKTKKELVDESPVKKSHWRVWVILILVLMGIGVVAYFYIFNDKFNLF